MDFIERWLHISPDHGNGSFELVLLAALTLAIVLVLCGVRAHRERSRR
jgi:hypothetical protein